MQVVKAGMSTNHQELEILMWVSTDDAAIYEVAQQLQKTVSKGTVKPQYEAAKQKADIV